MLGLINVNYVAPLDAMTSFNKYRALGIPELVWGSPNRFGDHIFGLGIGVTSIPKPKM